MTKLGDVEEWTIENTAQEAHMFHIHQLDFQVTQVNGELQPFSAIPNAPSHHECPRYSPGAISVRCIGTTGARPRASPLVHKSAEDPSASGPQAIPGDRLVDHISQEFDELMGIVESFALDAVSLQQIFLTGMIAVFRLSWCRSHEIGKFILFLE